MPNKYQYAKPFDIVRTIKQLQDSVKSLQLNVPGQSTAWQSLTLSSGWTGLLRAKVKSDGQLQLSGNHLIPGTISAGVSITTLPSDIIPAGNHEIAITTNVADVVANGNPRCYIQTNGNVAVWGLSSSATEVSIECIIPRDI